MHFPYMAWAHRESACSAYSLAQSGMPAPDVGWADRLARAPLDVAPPAAEALPALEARLAELFGVEPRRVLVTLGASGAMFLAALRWFRGGARVVTDVPSYEPFRALPALFGAELRTVERRLEEGWRLDPARVERALDGGAPGHVFVANPNNPTGARSGPEVVARLARAAAGAGGVLIANEIYMEFARPAERVHAFALAPNAVSIGSLTKAYGLGALRVGWAILGEELAGARDELTDLAYLAWVDPPTPALRAALAALDHLDELLAPVRRLEAECRPSFERWLAGAAGVEAREPDLGLATFARVDGVTDTRALQRYLAREWSVDVAPGEFFGVPGCLRLGYGVPRATLAEGLERLERGLAAFRGA